jgi:hypothetical protein
MTNLVRWARNHSTQRRTNLTSYSETSKIALEIKPVHDNIPNPRSRGTYATELDELAKLVLVSFANDLNATVWKIPHPAFDTQLRCQIGDSAAKENALHQSIDQNSRTNIQTRTLITF